VTDKRELDSIREDSSGFVFALFFIVSSQLAAAKVTKTPTALLSMSSLLLDIDASIIAVELLPFLDTKDLSQLTACCRVLRELGPDEFEKRDSRMRVGSPVLRLQESDWSASIRQTCMLPGWSSRQTATIARMIQPRGVGVATPSQI
jgi:hypothetical protein